ncbi:MAG: hypothetical protein ACYDEF_10790 [Methanosarcina sp.]
MFRYLENTESEIGTLNFYINDNGFLEIQTPKRFYAVEENELIKKDGKYCFPLPEKDYMIVNEDMFSKIEIPADILEEMEKALAEFKLQEKSVGSTETIHGRVFFSISEDGKITAKHKKKATKSDRVFNVECKKVVYVPEFDFDSVFVEIPSEVELELNRFQRDRAMKNLHLVYAGRSLLDGKDFFKFNIEVSENVMYRVKNLFEYFDEENEDSVLGGLQGWLTSQPELAEEYLRIRDPISGRQAEIEKQKVQAVKNNLKIIKQLTAKSATEV